MARDLPTAFSITGFPYDDANTHKRPHALPEYVHRHGRKPAERLTPAEDEQRDLDAAAEDHAVREERRGVEHHVLPEVAKREDVQRVRAVRVEQVSDGGGAGDNHAEVQHPARANTSQSHRRPAKDSECKDVRDARDCAYPRHAVVVPDGPADVPEHTEEHAEHEDEPELGLVYPAVPARDPDDAQSFSGPVTSIARTMPTMPPRFVKHCVCK